MKNVKSRNLISRLIVITIFFMTTTGILEAEEGPLFYLIPVKNTVFVVLGDTPRDIYGFKVYRKGPDEKEYKLLTKKAVMPVKDPYKAQEILGSDYGWIAKKVGTDDPVLLWQRLMGNRNLTMLLCLVSHRLRIAAGRTYIDKDNLIPGNQYTYKISFVNTVGKSILSKTGTVKIAPLPDQPNPTKVEAKAGDSRVSITWKYPSYTGSKKDLTVGFYIYRKKEEGRYTRLTKAPVFRIEKGLYYLDEKVENGKSYVYGVAPVDMVGNVGKIVESNPVTPIDQTPPLVPMGLTAKDTEEGVLLLWKMSSELDFDHYNILRAESLRGEYKQLNKVPLENPRFMDNSITRGRPYYYKVVAFDKSGNKSEPTGAVSIIPKDLTPPGPVKGIKVEIDEEKRYITLIWEPSKEKDVKGYYIYRGTQKNRMLRLTEHPYKIEKDKALYLDKGYKERGLRPGRHLFYGISACDESYNEGPVEYIEIDVPDNVPPHPVFAFSAEITPEGWVKLIWQPSLSTDLSMHRIYRSTDNKKSPEVLTEVKKEFTNYIDKTAEKGKTVKYYITEIDKSGNESAKSKVIEVVPTDIKTPGKPENFEIVSEKSRLKLFWNRPEDNDIAGYNVWYSKTGEEWIKLNKTLINDLSIVIKNSGDGFYGVSATDTSGNESKRTVKKYENLK